ncbi:MAG: holo-ACP synthase [Verrucomicrobia bacterium]|nr:holo-ACP synthase [Verrucomicrobiota bacterium]
MNLISLGLDFVEVSRIRSMLEKSGDQFKARVFTEGEVTYCDTCASPAMHYAARFAAKEAVAKALGTGLAEGVFWREIEVQRDAKGAPSVMLHGGAALKARELGIRDWRVSLTHTAELAGASVAAVG